MNALKKEAPGTLAAYWGMSKDDGVNHIRVDRYGITNLGRSLTMEYTRVFFHPTYGSFASIRSAVEWYLLEKKDDMVRQLSGPALIKYVEKEIESGNNRHLSRYIDDSLMDSFISYSILSHPYLHEEISQNQLPFICYVIESNGYAKVRNIRYIESLNRVIPNLGKIGHENEAEIITTIDIKEAI